MSKHDMAVDLARGLEGIRQAKEKIAEAMNLINISSVLIKNVGDEIYPMVLEEMNNNRNKKEK